MKPAVKTKHKILIAVLITVYTLFILVITALILEGLGTFVGVWMNRPSVDAYMSKHYADVSYKVVSAEYRSEKEEYLDFRITKNGYCYGCEVLSVEEGAYGTLKTGDVFYVKSYNFTVYYDDIYSVYNCDTELSEAIGSLYLKKIASFFKSSNAGFTPFYLFTDSAPKPGEYGDDELETRAQRALDRGIIKDSDLVMYVKGEKTDFEKYKVIISDIVSFYAEAAPGSYPDLIPRNLQIFYYYTDESEEDKVIYESQFTSAELKYTRSMITAANDMHFKMSPSAEEVNKTNAYNTVRFIYICVILAVVLGLSALWIIRKIVKTVKADKAVLAEETEKEMIEEEKETIEKENDGQ